MIRFVVYPCPTRGRFGMLVRQHACVTSVYIHPLPTGCEACTRDHVFLMEYCGEAVFVQCSMVNKGPLCTLVCGWFNTYNREWDLDWIWLVIDGFIFCFILPDPLCWRFTLLKEPLKLQDTINLECERNVSIFTKVKGFLIGYLLTHTLRVSLRFCNTLKAEKYLKSFSFCH